MATQATLANKKAIKAAFNEQVGELKKLIESHVGAIALEFSGCGSYYSQNQIRSQVYYRMAKPKTSCKPMLANAWAHAEAEARCLREDTELCLPYLEEYVELLQEIGSGSLLYDNVWGQQTLEEEHYARILLEGVMVKRDNRALKWMIISPELSMNSITMHARDQLVKTVASRTSSSLSHGNVAVQTCPAALVRCSPTEVVIIMTKGHSKDIFMPVLWGMEKAMGYWKTTAQQDLMMHTRLMEGYTVGAIQGEKVGKINDS
ncbi:uncharacterized protein EI90DRAFT_3016507 [Cantharellus anzutake]|uniref:uncharacterized protein n=1 Tax=Cantharellus anzutake TaxID=1750568 RepID=UPI001907E8EB|nr:uncharacterized protein EI90DRAFT_3016507 [Cantharellus anzutake]KAF8331057.1 hypothetical protein EI90DRAFT_3016507 [Cantharellus anzutake]